MRFALPKLKELAGQSRDYQHRLEQLTDELDKLRIRLATMAPREKKAHSSGF